MCGRYVLYQELDEINHFLNSIDSGKYSADGNGGYRPNYNVAPTHIMPVAFTNEDGKRILMPMHWGFMGWKPKKGEKPFTPFNTRSESVTEKPMWSKAFIQKRCIIPANGFYEWTGPKGNKTPYFIYPTENKLMGFAGIYSELAPVDKEAEMSFSIMLTSPNKVMEDIHNRMPVILHTTEFDDWLNPENADPNYLKEFLKPYPDDGIKAHIVSQDVNSTHKRINEPYLIKKADLFG